LNVDGRGELLGDFEANDKILTITQKGELALKNFDIATHFADDTIIIEKHTATKPISVIYFEGKKKQYFVKRFLLDKNLSKKISFISENKGSYLELVSTDWLPQIEIVFMKEKGKERKRKTIRLNEFIAIKGTKALGNKLTAGKVREINLLDPLPYEEIIELPSSEDQISLDANSDPDGQTKLEL